MPRLARPARALVAVLLALPLVAGCAALRGGSRFQGSLPASQLLAGAVDDLDAASLALAAEETARRLYKSDRKKLQHFGGHAVRGKDLLASAERVAKLARKYPDPARLTKELGRHCRAWPAGAPAKVTAYYEPQVAARRLRDERFRWPIYAMPSPQQQDAVRRKLGRMPTRGDIDGGAALDGLGLELAWLDDPVTRFFLQVQGSGRLVFEDGSVERASYAGANGLAYVSVGTIMLGRGHLERGKASAIAMQDWLRTHPAERDALLFENPRYVFFALRKVDEAWPLGSQGSMLVPGRSVAADPTQMPLGMLGWLRTSWPGRVGPVTRFVIAQDTGSAIQGPARLDVFTGSGEAAGREASAVNQPGELWLLMCR